MPVLCLLAGLENKSATRKTHIAALGNPGYRQVADLLPLFANGSGLSLAKWMTLDTTNVLQRRTRPVRNVAQIEL